MSGLKVTIRGTIENKNQFFFLITAAVNDTNQLKRIRSRKSIFWFQSKFVLFKLMDEYVKL